MANLPKPSELSSRKISKQERDARTAAEEDWRFGAIADYEPVALSEQGLQVFKELVLSIPEKVLCKTDGYTIEMAADAIDKMRECREILRAEGLIVPHVNKSGETVSEQNKAALLYQKYSDIASKKLAELGLTPSSRARIAQSASDRSAEKKRTVADIFADDD